MYPGIADKHLLPAYAKNISTIASDFLQTSQQEGASGSDFLVDIIRGLKRFEKLKPDTEDRERICLNIEELMDIIAMNSSDGELNKFVYGIDF